MDTRPLVFIDSGIGGLPYCREFQKNNPYEQIFYAADRKNFPYGPHGKEELASILISLTEKLIKKIDPKIIVMACNTATISAIAPLRGKFPQVPFVGTVPALKPAASHNYSKIGVLGTERTIENIRDLHLVDESCEIFGIAAPELVEFVEYNFERAGLDEKRAVVKKYIDRFREADVKTIVLGCTHFLFLLEEFLLEAAMNIEVFDSLAGITKRIEFLLDENDGLLRSGIRTIPVNYILVTGENADYSSFMNTAKSIGLNFKPFNENL